jgi:hypothetical protein
VLKGVRPTDDHDNQATDHHDAGTHDYHHDLRSGVRFVSSEHRCHCNFHPL